MNTDAPVDDASASGALDQNQSVDNSASNTPVDFMSSMDDDTRAFAESKGWSAPGDIIKSYQNVEKMVGGRVKIPDQEDTDGWNDLYSRLGRPEDKDAYEIEVGENVDEKTVSWFKEKAHAAGLTQAQAGQMFGSMAEQRAAEAQAAQDQAAIDSENQLGELKKEWGAGFNGKIGAAKNAATRFGVSDEMVDNMASAIGLSATLKHFAQIGEAISEDTFESGATAGGVGNNMSVTPAQANNQINELKNDPNFMQRYVNGDPHAVAKMDGLFARTM